MKTSKMQISESRRMTFEAREPGQPADSTMEHRWGIRRACGARVRILARPGISGSGRLRNISMSGAYVETALSLPLFAQVAVTLMRDDGEGQLVEFGATVVRRGPDGVGIEWYETAACSICQLVGCGKDCAMALVY